MNRKRYSKWIFMISLVAGLGSCGLDMPKETNTSFETMTVEKSDIELPYKFSARMKGQNDVTVTPQVSGQLTKICVTEGQQVKKGQDLESAQANLQAALAQENSAKLEYESNKNLYEKKIVSKYMLDNSLNTYRQAQASVAQARAAVSRARVNLGFCTITASVSGVIGEIPVRTGDQVSPGMQLTMLSGNTTMDAEISVTEAVIESMVQEGVKAADLEKILASATGSLTAKVSFPNPDGHLYSGIQGTVVLKFAEKDVIIVPQKAVVRLQDKAQVYKVQADSTATAIEVTTEDTGNGKDYIVTSGLNVGDRIVTIGANNVQEGQRVLFPKEEKEK